MQKFTFLLISGIIILGLSQFKNRIIDKDVAKEELRLPESHFFEYLGGEIHYTDMGEGMPVVMIHGFGGNANNWTDLSHLWEDNFRMLAVDLPGFGLSDLNEDRFIAEKFDYYMSFLDAFLTETKVDSFYLIGNSLGGWVSWEYALRHPEQVKKLVLSNSVGYNLEESNSKTAAIASSSIMDVAIKYGVPKFVIKLIGKGSYANKSNLSGATLDRYYTVYNRAGNLQALKVLSSCGLSPDEDNTRNIEMPTLIVWGVKDEVIPVEHAAIFAADIKQSSLAIYDFAGHIPLDEFTEETAPAVKTFLIN